MKYLISLIALCSLSACATHKTAVEYKSVVAVSGTAISHREMPEVRIPETVKAYPVGRYTDPNFPDEMHERHTLYRLEQSSNWSYQPDARYALPLGPTIAKSDPSPSYYVGTNDEMTTAQQRAYAEALIEENQALKKRVDALQQNEGAFKGEVQRLKQQLDSSPAPAPTPKQKPTPTPEPVEGFSSATPSRSDEFGFTDPTEIMLISQSDADNPAFLISQMRLNDEFAEQLDALERRRRDDVSDASRLSRQNLLTKNTP